MTKRKICVITGSRAEYGLLYLLIKKIKLDKNLVLQLIVTGMHLSSNFGMTFREIEKEFKILKKIDIDLSSDSSSGIVRSIGIGLNNFIKTFKEIKPDIIVILGDRYEIFSSAIAATVAKIPIAHIHGGERTEGAFDESIRHSITKMSHFHFAATNNYRQRIIQLGELPSKVYNVGGLGAEFLKKQKLLSKKEFEKSINFKFNKKNILVTFHPTTLEKNTSKIQFQELLNAINELEDTNIIFTKTNSDTNGKIINKMIDQFVFKYPKKAISFFSLGQIKYLSALKYVDICMGNSSSGLLEAPSFKIATVNIGDRQKGRIKADSVINCIPLKEDILKAINKVYSVNFQNLLKKIKNPYDNGESSKKIFKILKNSSFKNILKKRFHDITF